MACKRSTVRIRYSPLLPPNVELGQGKEINDILYTQATNEKKQAHPAARDCGGVAMKEKIPGDGSRHPRQARGRAGVAV